MDAKWFFRSGGPRVESLDPAEVGYIHDLWVSDAVCSTLLRPWSAGSRVALQFSPIMNKDQESVRENAPLLDTGRTGKESAADGPADYLEERSQVESSSSRSNQPLAQFSLGELSVRNGNAAFRAESVGFNLAADFLYSIVIPVDLMTFQTRDIGILRRSWLVLRFIVLCRRYRQASLWLGE